MKKLLFICIFSIFSYSDIVNKIKYNNNENTIELFLSSPIIKGEKFSIEKVDMLVDNFKYAKNNNIEVNIEPLQEGINIYVYNKKTNPLSLELSFDNYGIDEEDKYRYGINSTLEGLFINEKIDLEYIFTPSKIYERKNIEDLEIGDELEEDSRKSNKNETFNFNLSMPLRNNKIYFIYSNSNYLKSIESENNNIYDLSGDSNNYELKLDTLVYKNKNYSLNIINSYRHMDRKTYIYDTEISNDKMNIFQTSLKNKIDNHIISLGVENIFENGKYKFKVLNSYEYADIFKLKNEYIENALISDISLNLKYDKFYNTFNLKTDYQKIETKIKSGVVFDIKDLNIDMALEYEKDLRFLMGFKYKILR